jgi:drug/metabolite transporter (DMT)-like permease
MTTDSIRRMPLKGEESKMRFIYLILISIALSVTGQLFMKTGMNNYQMGEINLMNSIPVFLKIMFRPLVFIGFACFLASSFFWLLALSKVPLSFAYPLVSISYILILFFSWLLFKEHISMIRWLGAAVIIFGVYLISRSG